MTEIITTSPDELRQLVKDGYFFSFCVAVGLNEGFKDAMKSRQEIKFSVGDYEITFKQDHMCFEMVHKVYFARIINTYPNGETVFIGDDENEVIDDVLKELEVYLKNVH